jgi:hypothetical protein
VLPRSGGLFFPAATADVLCLFFLDIELPGESAYLYH